ncbi:MAG: hypothetical protein F9K10_03715, partial [Paludibacter sp.]
MKMNGFTCRVQLKNSVMMKKTRNNLQKTWALLFFWGLCLLATGRNHPAPEFVKNLSAPAFGVTSGTVVLLWDDVSEPDFMDEDFFQNPWTYEIYQDGIQIGSTTKRSYRVTGLSPGQTYQFSVGCNKNTEKLFLDENTVKVTTKKAGKIFNVKDFGASGDGKKQDTEAIQKTINTCEKGGTVLVPEGTYIVGGLTLKSDMTLEIAKGALIVFNGYNGTDLYPVTSTILPGMNGDTIEFQRPALIRGTNVHNLVITGEGTIDGNGETWWPNYPSGIEEINGISRPVLMVLAMCSEILIQGITMQDPPFHSNYVMYGNDVIYSEVKFLKYSTVPGRNGDALDPYACRNLIITGCTFGNQDDSVALKGHENFAFNEYIFVRD